MGFFSFFKKRKKSPKVSLTTSLSKPKHGFVDPLRMLLGQPSREIRDLLPQLEEVLLSGDVGVVTTEQLIASIKNDPSIQSGQAAYSFLEHQIINQLIPHTSFSFSANSPRVFFFVGINGTGKTTTIGKLASLWVQQGFKVLLVAADTFRAAAQEQLKIWAVRSGAAFVGGQMNADPASVVHDGMSAAKSRNIDLVLVDTAGRLHTKAPLMEELKKMVRVAQKELGRDIDECFLILDATTGQNGLSQAKIFQDSVPLTGLILTKFDGTAKGGILLSVVRETGLPLRFVGVGEGVGDLRPFAPREFVESLFKN